MLVLVILVIADLSSIFRKPFSPLNSYTVAEALLYTTSNDNCHVHA
ncbi:MAG TPA: hypothetical protein VNL13_01865 [Sulfolobales archaeon]|nr:hypothetical protein [Sulfolobales archaeon]